MTGVQTCALPICRDEIEHIQSHRSFIVRRIEDDHILRTLFRREGDDIFDEITVWVDDTESFTIPEILTSKIADED